MLPSKYFSGIKLFCILAVPTIILLGMMNKRDAEDFQNTKPNVIIIYADDLGYGDLSCYGAQKISTPNIDKLAAKGLIFTDGHCTSATCTPSRYAMITGQYPWRKEGTGILPGNAALIVPTDKITLPKLFQQAGYTTGIVGKWHLGMGSELQKDWSRPVKPGPNEVGFDYSFIFPATADRVPTVFLENEDVIALGKNDSIEVNYTTKIGNEPTGKENPDLLKQTASHGHDFTIVNGIGRIGYMKGGSTARWTDEELGYSFLIKAQQFIEENKAHPFFLYYSLTEPHVPRMPGTLFKEKSGLGFRGDAILQLDWAVGEIVKQLKYLGLEKNSIIVFSSDNGPVLDDGYNDDAVTRQNGHQPAGVLRGGKYSIFEAGTRVPFIVSWPGKIKPGKSSATVSQIDLLASFGQLLQQPIPKNEATDSKNVLAALMGKSTIGNKSIIEHANTLAIVKDGWKYIEPKDGEKIFISVNIESGLSAQPQLYDLKTDLSERNNLAEKFPNKVKELAALLKTAIENKP